MISLAKNKTRLIAIELKKLPPFYYILFAVYPILALYSDSIDQDPMLWQIVSLLVIFVVAFSVSMFIVINFFIRNAQKSGLIVFFFVFLFYIYGYVFEYFYDAGMLRDGYNFFILSRQIINENMWLGANRILLSLFFFFFLIGIIFVRKWQKSMNKLTNSLNILSLLLILLAVISLGDGLSHQIFLELSHNSYTETNNLSTKVNHIQYPDIYYIFLDMYPSSRTLKEFYNYDNNYFEEHLRQNGFLIANKSRPNYESDALRSSPTTFYLASTLNMNYLINLSKMNDAVEKDVGVPYDLIKNNEVLRFLKSKEYMTINIASSFGPTDFNPYADLNLGNDSGFLNADQKDFLYYYIKYTMLYPFYMSYFKNQDNQDRVMYAFSELEMIHNIKHPKFIMANFLCPHPPFIFGKNGEKIFGFGRKKSDKDSYLDQLTFMNKKLMELSDKLVLQSRDYPMIIIIQSDHGAPYHRTNLGAKDAYLTREVLQGSLTNFNAYYLPGKTDIKFNSITPVNLFRLIFNSYLGANYSLLDDRIYFSINKQYRFIDVTDKIFT